MIELPQMVAIADCHHPAWNPGTRHLDTSLAESIKAVGLLQHVVLRRIVRGTGKSARDAYEIVFGNRRVAGARAAGLVEIPAVVRDMTETEAIKLCGVENFQRHDLDPLEEADWLNQWLELDGEDVESAAATFGRTTKYVRERVNLARSLDRTWRAAHAGRGKFKAAGVDQWRFSHLAEVAKLPPASQKRLLKQLTPGEGVWPNYTNPGHVPTLARLRKWVAALTQALSAAPWKHADATLVKGKPCTGCPTRSDARGNLELWEDLVADGKRGPVPRCLDESCWRKKLEAFRDRVIANARKEHGDELVAWSSSWTGASKWEGLRLIHGYPYEVCKAEDRGAIPAIGASEHGAKYLKLVWIRNVEGRTGKGGKPVSKTVPEKRNLLDGRRAVLAVDELLAEAVPPEGTDEGTDVGIAEWDDETQTSEAVEEVLGDEDLDGGDQEAAPAEVELVDVYTVLSLVLAFGTARRREQGEWHYRDPVASWAMGEPRDWSTGRESWEIFDAIEAIRSRNGGKRELLEALWKYLVLPVLRNRLRSRHHSPDERVELRYEAERFCDLVGIDFGAFWSRAVEAKPEPKSWAKQEAATEA